jgi:hypothetical protein
MRFQLAILEGLQDEALRRLETGESGEAWAELQVIGKSLAGKLREIKALQKTDDGKAASVTARKMLVEIEDQLLPLIERGVKEEAGREEIVDLFVKRAKIIRVQQQGERTVPIETLGALQARFIAMMTKYVTDPRAISRLIGELREAALPGWSLAVQAVPKVINGNGQTPKAQQVIAPDGEVIV